jgi:LysM repeat protein
MFKRTAIILAILSTLAVGFASSVVSAKGTDQLQVRATRQFGLGITRSYEFDIANISSRDLTVHGQVVLINVYDSAAPITFPVSDLPIPAGGVATVGIRWEDAPLIGQVRAELMLTDGQDPPLIESFQYWILPLEQTAFFIGIAALAVAIGLAALRLPKYMRVRVPGNMLTYRVEQDDSVVTLAVQFDVSWQDIVRANRIKPPYALKIGQRLLIPKHAMRHGAPEKTS